MKNKDSRELSQIWAEYRYYSDRCFELETALRSHEYRYMSVSGIRYDKERFTGGRSDVDKGLLYVALKDQLTAELKEHIQARSRLKREMQSALEPYVEKMSEIKRHVTRMYFVELLPICDIASATGRAYKSIDAILHKVEKGLNLSRKPVFFEGKTRDFEDD